MQLLGTTNIVYICKLTLWTSHWLEYPFNIQQSTLDFILGNSSRIRVLIWVLIWARLYFHKNPMHQLVGSYNKHYPIFDYVWMCTIFLIAIWLLKHYKQLNRRSDFNTWLTLLQLVFVIWFKNFTLVITHSFLSVSLGRGGHQKAASHWGSGALCRQCLRENPSSLWHSGSRVPSQETLVLSQATTTSQNILFMTPNDLFTARIYSYYKALLFETCNISNHLLQHLPRPLSLVFMFFCSF